MAMATPGRLTKSRISALILESTAATVALVLVLWLLLWFIWQVPGPAQIEAFFVTPEIAFAEEVPYQSADVRFLRGSPTLDGHWEAKSSELLDALKGIIDRGGPVVVIYVNEPVVATDPGAGGGEASIESVISLIKTIASDSQRDVILALDLAQVDSDRDLGIFGNSPYQGLAERMRDLPVGDRSILILTSCAPAQKSWGADGLGQSAFSYYLRKGMEGGARGWDGSGEGITAEGLHRYVRAHVSAWAKKNCRAIQTPMLIPVGKSVRKVSLSTLPPIVASRDLAVEKPGFGTSAPSNAPEAKGHAKGNPAAKGKEKPEPSEPELSPRETLLRDLLNEWKEHDRLRKHDPPPYRHFPGAWRYYQSTLIQAERRLRAAWLDSDRINPSREALQGALAQRTAIEELLERQGNDEMKFPFHPGMNVKEGKREIDKALAYLTGIAMGGGAAGKGGVPTAPSCLLDVAEGDYPRNFLELQLPVWACRFTDTFRRPDYFKNDHRAGQLSRLVDERSKAEQALAIDRRGTRYVRALIESGDRDRRQLQDDLFAVSGEPGGAHAGRFADQINRVAASYDAALGVIKAFQEARGVLEEIAAELPDLADWSIRSRSHALAGDRTISDEPLPPSVEDVFEGVRHLIQVLDQGTPGDQGETSLIEPLRRWSGELKNLTQPARQALEALDSEFEERTRPDLVNDWVACDLALRTPLLRLDRRRVLLARVLETNEEVQVGPPDQSMTGPATEYPHDPGFWARAAGLADLDLALHQVSRGVGREQDPQSLRLNQIRSLIAPSTEDRQGAAALFESFSDISRDTRQRRGAAVVQPHRPRDGDRRPEEIEQKLRLEDRATRFLTAGEIHRRGLERHRWARGGL